MRGGRWATAVFGCALLGGAVGCKGTRTPTPAATPGPPSAALPEERPAAALAPPTQPPAPAGPAEPAIAEAADPGVAAVRSITPAELVTLLKGRKELRALTMQTAGARFAGLVPAFDEKSRDDEQWEFEGSNDSGLVRSVTLSFTPTGDDVWRFRSVSVRIHSGDPRRTFQEIRRAANASLKRPKWLDLNARDRTAWSLGEGWELVAAVLDDGDIHLRSGRPAGP